MEPSPSTSPARSTPPVDGGNALGRAQILQSLRERIVAFAASRYAREHAEDLAQEVLVVIHEKYETVERMEELVPLAMQIMRFKLSAHWRMQKRHGERNQVDAEEYPLHSDAPDPESTLAKKELLDRLGKGIAQLGPRCREIFRLKLQGRSFPEIREAMGADALNTVYTWDHRCRKQLMEWMGGPWK